MEDYGQVKQHLNWKKASAYQKLVKLEWAGDKTKKTVK